MNNFSILEAISALAAGTIMADTVNFDQMTPGQPPAGWTDTKTDFRCGAR